MKILVPLDGTPLAESVLPCAHTLARDWQSELELVRVVDDMSTAAPDLSPSLLLQMKEQAVQASALYLKSVADRMEGIRVSFTTPVGPAAEQLAAVAQRERCSLMVMASHGHTGVGRWLLGSVAERLLRLAHCEVLLLRPPASPAARFQHILVAVDGSQASLAVVPKVAAYLVSGGRVTLLQVSSASILQRFTGFGAEEARAHQHDLRQRLGQVRLEGIALEVQVLEGDPADTIVNWAQQNGCDLIAMSTHGRTGFSHPWLGSVTAKVARHAHCAVLVVPHPEGPKGQTL
ncbi:universal stress protein [bacterium]|nr:universal stress protein [bacterium]